jgi:endoglucanase
VVLDLPDFRLDGDRVTMRAVDDLAGCACMLMALERAVQEQPPGDLYALFTRAEEVGLIGARLTASEGRLPPNCLVVSLEASRTLPGAVIGEGPVIRVGDATYTFDAEAEQVLHTAREELREVDPEFKCQRQLMSGGTCEASAFAIHGYRTTGVAFPLANYHNAGPEGEVAAEQISIEDFVSGVRLVCQALQSVPRRNDSPARRRLRTIPPEHQERLTRPAP